MTCWRPTEGEVVTHVVGRDLHFGGTVTLALGGRDLQLVGQDLHLMGQSSFCSRRGGGGTYI